MPPDRLMVEEFSILVTSEVLLQTSRHVAQNTTHEMGGFLLGNRYRCPNTGREYIIIDQYSEAEFTESTDVSLTFTHEAWGQLDDKLTGKYYGKKLVGWYHSHPGMSIFLSEHDVTIHRERFAEPWMVALVLEPVKHLGGFFVWNNGKIDPNHYVNFYELLEGETRESVVAWGNYDGLDPVLGVAPQVQGDNTQSENQSSNGAARRPRPPQPPVPPPAPGLLPVWLQGNLAWFSAAGLAALIFLGALAAIYFPWGAKRNPATANAGVNVLRTLKSEPEGRGDVNAENGTIFVRLNLTGISQDVAKGMTAFVTIEDVEADVKVVTGQQVVVEATAPLAEKAARIAQNGGQGETLKLTETYEYGGSTRTLDRTVTNIRLAKNEPMNLVLNEISRPDIIDRQDDEVAANPRSTPRARPKVTPTRPPTTRPSPAPTSQPQRPNNAQDSQRTLGIKADIVRINRDMGVLKGKMDGVKPEDRDKKSYKNMAAQYKLLQNTLNSRLSELAAATAKRVD